jgi:hypothetical protein
LVGYRTDFRRDWPIIGGWRYVQYDGIVAMAAASISGAAKG